MNAAPQITDHQMELISLPRLNEIGQLNQWMYERFLPYTMGNILEIGSGSGNIANLFIQDRIPITLSDADLCYCELLKKKFENEKMVNAIVQIDLSHKDFEEIYGRLLGSFHTVFSLNIVDHLPYEHAALANAKKLIAPSGHLIMLLPAYAALYRELDQGLDHWHNYNRQYIKKLLNNEFKIIKTRYFNLLGIVRWFLSAPMIRTTSLPSKNQIRYNKLVPTFCVEDLAFKQKGLSMIIVAQKIHA